MSRIPRIHTRQRLATEAEITLDSEASRHLVRVLRLGPGDPVVLFDGLGGEYTARISRVNKETAVAQVGQFRDIERESPLRITLCQGISRGKRMAYTLQKAVELGVHSIVPVETARSMGGLRSQGRKYRQRWARIVRSAAEQSGRTRIPAVEDICLFDGILATPAEGQAFVLTPDAERGANNLREPPESLHVLAGPEGGLTEQETRQALEAGFRGLRLGPRTLRTETAGVAALAILQSQWGDIRTIREM